MILNANKTKTIIVSRSRIMHPQSPLFTIGGTVLKESDDLVTVGMTFDSRKTFEKHLCLASRAVLPSQRIGILVSRLSPGRCSLIDRFLGDAFGVLSCPFWTTVMQCDARLPIHTLNYWTLQLVVPGF